MNTIEKFNEHIVGSYGRQNVVFVEGKKSTLIDEDGKEYIDFGSGIAVNGLGISQDEWADEVCKQVKKLAHTSNLYYNVAQSNLAKMLCDRTGLDKVFFGNSGAEANEGAIKCARKYSFDKYGEGRYEIICLKQSFHGRTMATLSATGQDVFHTMFNPFLEGFKFATANDIQSIKDLVSSKTCGIMMELVQGEGGVIPLDKTFVKEVEKICNDNDLVLIIDEVQTGNGRTGTLYAFEQYDIKPDIVTTAKGLGNGLPIGAVMFSKKTSGVFTVGTHGSTFGGNPICCAGACKVLEQIDNKLLTEVKKKSELIFNTLLKCEKVKSVTGLGLMIGIEVDNANEIKEKCLQNGLVVLTAKTKLRLLPALTISYEELEKGLKILIEQLN